MQVSDRTVTVSSLPFYALPGILYWKRLVAVVKTCEMHFCEYPCNKPRELLDKDRAFWPTLGASPSVACSFFRKEYRVYFLNLYRSPSLTVLVRLKISRGTKSLGNFCCGYCHLLELASTLLMLVSWYHDTQSYRIKKCWNHRIRASISLCETNFEEYLA